MIYKLKSLVSCKMQCPTVFLCHHRTYSRVAIPRRTAQGTRGPTSTHTCLHDPTPLCPSPLRERGRGRRHWRAPGACPTLAAPRPAWETESSSYASCRQRWRGWRAGARTWSERQRRTNCQRKVSLGGRSKRIREKRINNDDSWFSKTTCALFP